MDIFWLSIPVGLFLWVIFPIAGAVLGKIAEISAWIGQGPQPPTPDWRAQVAAVIASAPDRPVTAPQGQAAAHRGH